MSKIIAVSNRLPVQVDHGIRKTSGGLASALEGAARDKSLYWIGWPGAEVLLGDQAMCADELAEKFNYHPVFLTAQQIEDYYNGFSNAGLWPLLHYMPNYSRFEAKHFAAYEHVNQLFAHEVIDTADSGDTVWVHDYHLMLVPSIVKKKRPDVKVGFFLHTPFPSYEVYRYHPQREVLLQGLLGADLVGFHTFGYLRHFRSSVLRLLDHDSDVNFIDHDGHRTHIGVFPIGINWQGFGQVMNTAAFAAYRAEYKQRFLGKKMVLSVERLDYTKGIPAKLEGIRHYLQAHPRASEHVVFLIVGVPSRQDVREYQDLEHHVQQMVAEINGRFSTLTDAPIHFYHRGVPMEQLAALYSLADVCMVTPLIDGLNLVAKEYIACQPLGDGGEPGVLILSEFAGAAQELFNALIVNPCDSESLSHAIERAMEMELSEREARMAPMKERVIRYDARYWASHFLETLDKVTGPKFAPHDPAKPITAEAIDRFNTHAGRKLLMLDYDGTLREFVDQPHQAVPGKELLTIFAGLDKRLDLDVALVSGRKADFLEKHFGTYGFTLVAEHGFRLREPGGEWRFFHPALDTSWKQKVRPLLDLYAMTTPGTFVEDKSSGLVFHYRQADPEFGARKAAELIGELPEVISNLPVVLTHGKKIVEISAQQVNKGMVVAELLSRHECGMGLCAGDDVTDETMFELRGPKLITIKVGQGGTKAEYRVPSPAAMRQLLLRLLSDDVGELVGSSMREC